MDTTKPDFPDLCSPLEIQEVLVHEVLLLDMNLSCENDVKYRDSLDCFRDETYAQLPQKGPLHSLYYTTLVYPPTRLSGHAAAAS
jgi:hypothetical protein